MEAIAICGSRNPDGQTARATGALLRGLQKEGVDVEQVFLPTLELERCCQCDDDGWGLCRSEGRCVIEDDLPGLVEKIDAADLVVLSTPVYFGGLSESMHALTNRLRRTCAHESGRARLAETTAVGVCVAGGGGGGAPKCCVRLKEMATRCGFEVVDMIPVRRQNLEAKLERLRLAGEWLASEPGSD